MNEETRRGSKGRERRREVLGSVPQELPFNKIVMGSKALSLAISINGEDIDNVGLAVAHGVLSVRLNVLELVA